MINSIKIKNIATYNNIGISIDNFTKVNFIYGANRTGKTTLSNVLHSPNDFQDQEYAVLWKNNTLLTLITYNQNFRELHFNTRKTSGVFSLGSATIHIEFQEAINDKFFDVFYKISKQTNHTEHYNMMMSITTYEQT